MKLSSAQIGLLKDISQEPGYVAEHYPPALKLVSMGLCEWKVSKRQRKSLHITELGLSELKKLGEIE